MVIFDVWLHGFSLHLIKTVAFKIELHLGVFDFSVY